MALHEHTEEKERLSTRERLKQAGEYERKLQQHVHDKGRNLELPSWLIKAFMLTRLFQIETATASEMENEVSIGEIPFAEQVQSDVELPQETRDALNEYAAKNAVFSMTVQTRDGEVIQGTVFPKQLLGDHPRVIEGTVVQMSICSFISPAEFSEIRSNVARAKGEKTDTVTQQDQIIFEYGDREKLLTGRTVILPVPESTNPEEAYARLDLMNETGNLHKTNRDESVAFSFSFDFIGEPEVRDLFYHDPLPFHGDVQGIPISWSGIDQERGEHLLASNRASIENGISTVQKQFGPEILESTMSHIVFVDRNEENAFAHWKGLYLEEDLIIGVEKGKLTGKNVEETTEHELYHLIDTRYEFSRELENLFLSSDQSVLAMLNESSFSKEGFGGHAQDNPRELFASVMNSLDDPNWENSVRALSGDARDVYLASLRTISAKIQARDLEFSSGSLLQELPKRIAFIESLSTH